MTRPHDLRHTGNTLAVSTAASDRESTARAGPGTARTSLIHQHAGADRGRLIADAPTGPADRGRKAPGHPEGYAGDMAD
ncbi:hypothetical protein QFZ63_005154 [Streptomyces sp. B3I7]|nr:hypothetical protein [Streptomyces sp. B3I7]